ncbi:PepSY-associated TM helix domain-containing protein [Flavihumibacter sp. UBA7668]|uniref:PepSY-associated TM helix domain-containing protein n=1 Tax=Flavihumibacter sp. UBA7668 TaxID=1946542 RepID=UPI0025BCF472|nr:PepSY-associated TM helix domain-containing protein [Flavihumibacter sp. UBA7668]
MKFKKLIGVAHLWLGLASGILVVFLGITGCLLAFEKEIRNLTEPYQFVTKQDKPYLPPSQLKAIAAKHLDGRPVRGLEYAGPDKAAFAAYYDTVAYTIVAMNPYTGEVLKVKDMTKDFFRIVLNGHFYLWLPPTIGRPIVASATLVFLVMLISGIVLWWPKNKAAMKQRFSIKWNAKWRRVNYDLHNVLGFYMSWIGIFLALTGLVWGFDWFADATYYATSGGKQRPPHEHPVSKPNTEGKNTDLIADYLWAGHLLNMKETESITVFYPDLDTDPLEMGVNHRPGTYYKVDYYHYDRFSGEELPATGSYAGSFNEASLADKLVRMNYDIHVGAVLGLPGKFLAFFGSLIAASLPVTGFLLWRGRRKKKTAPQRVAQDVIFQPA